MEGERKKMKKQKNTTKICPSEVGACIARPKYEDNTLKRKKRNYTNSISNNDFILL